MNGSFTISVLVVAAVGLAVVPRTPFADGLVESVIFNPKPGIDATPERLGVAGEEVFLETEDGVEIHAFDLPSPVPTDRAILFLHGNTGNASQRLPNAVQLAKLGARVLLLEYRGYGSSEGRATIAGILLDSEAGLAHLLAQGVRLERIVLFGRSLGGGVAAQLARDRPFGGVILESTFSNVADVARSVFGPLRGRVAAWIAGDRLDSRSALSRLQSPLLVIHGDRDTDVPFALGEALFEAAPGPKALVRVAGASHSDLVVVGGRAYLERIGAFLAEVVPRRTVANE